MAVMKLDEAFFLRIEGDLVFLFGGNQLEEVREHAYPLASVLSYRWPVRGVQTVGERAGAFAGTEIV